MVAVVQGQRVFAVQQGAIATRQCDAVDLQRAPRHVHIRQAFRIQHLGGSFAAVQQACPDGGIGVHGHRAVLSPARGNAHQAAPAVCGREVFLRVAGAYAGEQGLDPDLQEMGGLVGQRIEFAVAHAPACAHALYVARVQDASGGLCRISPWCARGRRAARLLAGAFVQVVLVAQGAVEHIAHDLHVAVPVRAKAFAGRHRVIVEHQQVAMALVAQVKVVAKRKAVGAV